MQDYFYGWYLKCQSNTQTLAIIPAVHQSNGKRSCSIQIITSADMASANFPAWTYWQSSAGGNIFKPLKKSRGEIIVIGENIFCEKGVKISVHKKNMQVEGELFFRELTPLRYDIMGPFAMVPFMECRHRVYSMQHVVNGNIVFNGKSYVFCDAAGYWEGDRGTSFPKEYLWTQCCFDGGALVLSVADIPMCGNHFTGVIGVVYWHGKEYRLATYLGARVRWLGNGMVRIGQGDMELEARLLDWNNVCNVGKALHAPIGGSMSRTIHENIACNASYYFRKGNEVCLNFASNLASFEYEYHY